MPHDHLCSICDGRFTCAAADLAAAECDEFFYHECDECCPPITAVGYGLALNPDPVLRPQQSGG